MIKKGLLEQRLETEDVFVPKLQDIDIQIQRIFYFGSITVNEIIRDFYEGLAKAIFSGELRDRQRENVSIEPDLTDRTRKRYIEVKAAGRTRRVMLKDEQIKKYLSLQFSDYPIRDPRIYFVIFRYGTRGIKRRVDGLSREGVLEYLAGDTRFMIGLPFSIVHCVHEKGPQINNFFSRYDGERTACTNFSSRAIDMFFAYPEEAIKCMSLNPDDFKIRRTKLTSDVTINSYNVQAFPMTLIKNTDEYNESWRKGLLGKLKRDVPF